MADQAGQPSLQDMLRQSVHHPDLGNITPGGVSSQNPSGYNPANVQDQASEYTQKWNEQFGGQPAPEQPPAGQAETPQALPGGQLEPQVPRDDKGRFTKLYAGKYRSPEDLETAYLNQFQETQRIIAERDATKAAISLLNQQQPYRTREERQDPIKVNVPADGEPFIDPRQLDSFVEQRAKQVAMQQITETLGPILRSNQALTNVRTSYPDFTQHEADFTKWLSINPELTQKIAADPDIGVEYAYLKFQRERGAVLSAQAQAQAAQSQPQIDQARQHAAPPRAGRNEPNENMARDQQLAQLYQLGQETGNWKPYQNFRLREAIPDWHIKTEWGK